MMTFYVDWELTFLRIRFSLIICAGAMQTKTKTRKIESICYINIVMGEKTLVTFEALHSFVFIYKAIFIFQYLHSGRLLDVF